MPPRWRKRAVKQPPAPAMPAEEARSRDCQDEDPLTRQLDQEVERQAAVLAANRDVEIEHLLTGVQLLRLSVTEEQMDTPVSQFFSDILPNLSIESGGDDGRLEMRWKEKDSTSLLSRMSMAYLAARLQSHILVDSNSLPNPILDDPSDSQMTVLQYMFRTPGMNSQRLSMGMTPKSVRIPKPGEMLLSVHGSPLGVYPQENLEAINESDEC